MERTKKYDRTKLVRSSDADGIKDLAEHLKGGEVVGFTTETVYGLGADATNADAVKKIFEAKGRPSDNPLICHIASKDQIKDLVAEITPVAQELIDSFMPGPITVIMKKSSIIPDEVTAGLDTVGVRMPSNEVAAHFLKECGVPVAAPSANLSGSPSPTTALHVMNDMDGYVYGIIDGGECLFGLESTVVDATGEVPVILRPGAVTAAMIKDVCGDVKISGSLKEGETPKAPGMKYRHYAPKAIVEIMELPSKAVIINDELDTEIDYSNSDDKTHLDFKKLDDDQKQDLVDIAAPFVFRIREILKDSPATRIGIYAGDEVCALIDKLGDKIISAHTETYAYGPSLDVARASHFLFDGLRHLDLQDVGIILAQGFGGKGLSQAYMNRLTKASGKSGDVPEGVSLSSERTDGSYELDSFEGTYTASVLFVCDDNKCLSQACEGVLTDIIRKRSPFCLREDNKIGCELYAESAGIRAYQDEKPDPDMVKAMNEACGINISSYRSKRAEPSVYDANDLILTMRDEQAYEILSSFPELDGKVFSLSSYCAGKGLVFKNEDGRVASISIPDPKGENYVTYLHTASALKAWLELIFPYLLKDLGVERC